MQGSLCRQIRHAVLAAIFFSFADVRWANGKDRPGLEAMEWQQFEELSGEERQLIMALREPMLAGRDVQGALQKWFDGRLYASLGRPEEAKNAWREGVKWLEANTTVPELPATDWGETPTAEFTFLETLSSGTGKARCQIVKWTVDGLTQYGVLLTPHRVDPRQVVENGKLPLILYMHGAAYGVPHHVLPWLGELAQNGYAVLGPALRGEELFAGYGLPRNLPKYTSEGKIENLDGEVDDALVGTEAAKALPGIRDRGFAMLGHSFGAGVGLLAAARHPETVCAVSYDAWLVNPFRYYWDRMRRGANNWLSWGAYCNQPVNKQLQGLKHRSIVHNAERLHCPILFFIGGAYRGSVFHQSHQDLMTQLDRHGTPYTYDVVEGGGHNFILYLHSEQARYATRKHMVFLEKHWPPAKRGEEATPDQPVEQTGGDDQPEANAGAGQ